MAVMCVGVLPRLNAPILTDKKRSATISRHRKRLTEIFYVVEGEIELLLEQRRVMASPGTFMRVPQGTPHDFSNPGPRRSKLLILFCPADSREGYFEGLAELTRDGRQPTHEDLVELMRRFDQYLVSGVTRCCRRGWPWSLCLCYHREANSAMLMTGSHFSRDLGPG